MRTFILEWRPAISSYKMEAFEEDFHYLEYGEFNWSVWDWQNARSGDNFYMIKCGEGKTGIVMKGFFTSDPYEADDWSGKQRQVHYMDYRPTFMIHPNHPKGMLTTDQLEKEFPDFEWNGGHSGRLLPERIAAGLNDMWDKYVSQFSAKDADGQTLEFNNIPEAGVDDAIRQVSYAMYDKKGPDGEPLILHSLKVGLAGKTDEEKICGFLGHILEVPRTEINAGYLRDEGFSERIVDIILLLCHTEGMSYESYVKKIVSSGDQTALTVAKNDIVIALETAAGNGDEQRAQEYANNLNLFPSLTK